MPTLAEIVEDPRRAGDLPPHVASVYLVRLAGLLPLLTARAARAESDTCREADRLLTVEEAARKMAVSRDHLYRHADKFPFTVRVGRKLRFSELRIERWIERRAGMR